MSDEFFRKAWDGGEGVLMGPASGATSLVQLILKKWGDDAAGAAKELEEKVGFPESVANRIATGELPMDAESVARRAQDQDYGDVVYRGINGEYDPDKAGYYQMFTTSRQDAAEYGDNVIEARLNLGDNAVADGGGRNFNSIPTEDGLLVRTDDLAHEAREAGRDSLTIRNIHDKADNEIPRRPSASNTGPSDEEIMRELGLEYSPSPNASPAAGARNYDPVDVDVVFDPSRIRSPNAAFDPEYTGNNIMGNATVPMLGGTAAITAGALAAPALMKDGVFQHTASETPIVERKEPVRNQSSLLESVTDFGDEVIKSAKHAAGPLSLLVPYEGINDYLKVVNDYDKQPTWGDRLGLFDF